VLEETISAATSTVTISGTRRSMIFLEQFTMNLKTDSFDRFCSAVSDL